MNYSKIITYDACNGEGWRVTLYVSGCCRNCPGCFNPCAHDPNHGTPFTQKTKELIYKELDNPKISGLSFLGGDPLSKLSDNRKQVIQFSKEVKEKYPDKTIWLWSGYTFDEIVSDDTMKGILDYVDVLVDGPFKQELHTQDLQWKGSSNQHVINVAEWRKNNAK